MTTLWWLLHIDALHQASAPVIHQAFYLISKPLILLSRDLPCPAWPAASQGFRSTKWVHWEYGLPLLLWFPLTQICWDNPCVCLVYFTRYLAYREKHIRISILSFWRQTLNMWVLVPTVTWKFPGHGFLITGCSVFLLIWILPPSRNSVN